MKKVISAFALTLLFTGVANATYCSGYVDEIYASSKTISLSNYSGEFYVRDSNDFLVIVNAAMNNKPVTFDAVEMDGSDITKSNASCNETDPDEKLTARSVVVNL